MYTNPYDTVALLFVVGFVLGILIKHIPRAVRRHMRRKRIQEFKDRLCEHGYDYNDCPDCRH